MHRNSPDEETLSIFHDTCDNTRQRPTRSGAAVQWRRHTERILQLFSSTKEDELVEPDQAFKLKVAPKGSNTLLAELAPATGYYLYKEKIRCSLKDRPDAVTSAVKLPVGEIKADQIFGKSEVL